MDLGMSIGISIRVIQGAGEAINTVRERHDLHGQQGDECSGQTNWRQYPKHGLQETGAVILGFHLCQFPPLDQSGGNFDKAIQAHAKIQAEWLRTSSTVICHAVKASQLKAEAGVYDLVTGKIALS